MTIDSYINPTLLATLAFDPLPKDEELRVARLAWRGDRAAMERLVQTNARLVYTMAKQIARNPQDIADYFSVGLLALATAAKRYDPKRAAATGARFGTYATWLVRQQMKKHLTSMLLGPGSLKSNGFALMATIRKFMSNFKDEHGRDPSVEEISDGIRVSLSKVHGVIAFITSTSLDAPLSENDDGFSRHDQIMTDMPSADESAERGDRYRMLESALAELSETEQDILRRRFGLGRGGREETLEEIALRRGVTRERIRQIEALALKKIRIAASRKTNRLVELAA